MIGILNSCDLISSSLFWFRIYVWMFEFCWWFSSLITVVGWIAFRWLPRESWRSSRISRRIHLLLAVQVRIIAHNFDKFSLLFLKFLSRSWVSFCTSVCWQKMQFFLITDCFCCLFCSCFCLFVFFGVYL